jgi:hypothetical protein
LLDDLDFFMDDVLLEAAFRLGAIFDGDWSGSARRSASVDSIEVFYLTEHLYYYGITYVKKIGFYAINLSLGLAP